MESRSSVARKKTTNGHAVPAPVRDLDLTELLGALQMCIRDRS